MTAFRVFSGWDKRQAEAAEVFAYSVYHHASIDVEVGYTTVPERQGVTAFTYARFLVPWLCGYEGRAVFADGCDQLCLGDVAELAAFDMQDRPIAVVKHVDERRVPRYGRLRSWTSLMLLDCAQLTKWTPQYVETAPDDVLMRLRDFGDDQIGSLPEAWNVLMPDTSNMITLEVIDPPVKLAHWSYLSDPNGKSWIDRSGSALWADWRARWRASPAPAPEAA